MTNQIVLVIVAGLLVVWLFALWAIRKMADAGEKATNLAQEGRQKLEQAQNSSLSAHAEIRRLQELISNMKRSGNSSPKSGSDIGLDVGNREDAKKILGLGAEFTQKELKKNYFSLSKKVHPDVQGSDGLFLVLQSAYDILKE